MATPGSSMFYTKFFSFNPIMRSLGQLRIAQKRCQLEEGTLTFSEHRKLSILVHYWKSYTRFCIELSFKKSSAFCYPYITWDMCTHVNKPWWCWYGHIENFEISKIIIWDVRYVICRISLYSYKLVLCQFSWASDKV